jgi:hypothetical protein
LRPAGRLARTDRLHDSHVNTVIRQVETRRVLLDRLGEVVGLHPGFILEAFHWLAIEVALDL